MLDDARLYEILCETTDTESDLFLIAGELLLLRREEARRAEREATTTKRVPWADVIRGKSANGA
jgi:hypothetical protein